MHFSSFNPNDRFGFINFFYYCPVNNGISGLKHLNLNFLSAIVRIGAYFFPRRGMAGRRPDFISNTMQAHRRWAQLGECDMRRIVRRRRTSAITNFLSIIKFLSEALILCSLRTKLRTSARFLHGLLTLKSVLRTAHIFDVFIGQQCFFMRTLLSWLLHSFH